MIEPDVVDSLWMVNSAPVVGEFNNDILYGIGTIIVALATLIGAYATYRSIKDRSQLRSYDELEEELEQTRIEFRERLAARDRQHQEERDNIDARWRKHNDEQVAELRAELDTVKTNLRSTTMEVQEIKRVSLAAIRHIDEKDNQLIAAGIEPHPLPIEVEMFKDRELNRGTE